MPEYVPGGRSIGYTIAVEIRLRKGDIITVGTGDNKYPVGQVVKFKIEKNKTYKPYTTGEFDFYFDEGGLLPAGNIDTAKELIIESIVYGIIEKRGSWFYYNGQNLAQGQDTTIELVRNNPQLFAEIRSKVLSVAFEADVEKEDVFEDGVDDEESLPPNSVEEELPLESVKKKGRKK